MVVVKQEERTDSPKYFLKENHMESFKKYVSEREKPKNYVLKMDTAKNIFLLDSEGNEIKKFDKKKEALDYVKEKGYTVIQFNEDRIQEI